MNMKTIIGYALALAVAPAACNRFDDKTDNDEYVAGTTVQAATISTGSSHTHTLDPFMPVLRISKGLAGHESSMHQGLSASMATMGYEQEGDAASLPVTLTEIGSTGVYKGSAMKLMRAGEYEFKAGWMHDGMAMSKHQHVEAGRAHTSTANYRIEFEPVGEHIDSGDTVELRFFVKDKITKAPIGGLSNVAVTVQSRIYFAGATASTGSTANPAVTEDAAGGYYKASYTFGSSGSEQLWDIKLDVGGESAIWQFTTHK